MSRMSEKFGPVLPAHKVSGSTGLMSRDERQVVGTDSVVLAGKADAYLRERGVPILEGQLDSLRPDVEPEPGGDVLEEGSYRLGVEAPSISRSVRL